MLVANQADYGRENPPAKKVLLLLQSRHRVVICRLCREKAQREKDNRTRRLPSTPFSDPSRGERRGGSRWRPFRPRRPVLLQTEPDPICHEKSSVAPPMAQDPGDIGAMCRNRAIKPPMPAVNSNRSNFGDVGGGYPNYVPLPKQKRENKKKSGLRHVRYGG